MQLCHVGVLCVQGDKSIAALDRTILNMARYSIFTCVTSSFSALTHICSKRFMVL